MSWYEHFLKKFFHDPIDKPFDIPTHEKRAKEYAQFFGVSNIERENYKYSDMIASCMERSFLPLKTEQKEPTKITQPFTEIRHPLSDEKIEVNLENDIVLQKFRSIIQEIAPKYERLENIEQKSFSIWRNLIEDIKEKIEDEELKKFLLLLPADTRIPDHSIWEHLKITTAINSFEEFQNNSLLLFNLGPVQSFLSQARKTQDFYMSSFIISYLTFIAIEEVIEKYGPTSIIYPDLYKQPLMDWYLKKKKQISIKDFSLENITIPTIPNRFVAIIGTTDKKEIHNLANCITEKIKTEIEKAISIILGELKISLSNDIREILDIQLSNFPQIYWVAVPWRRGETDLQIDDLKDFFSDEQLTNWKDLQNYIKEKGEFPPNIGFLYQLLYTVLEKSLRARKNLREFEQKKEKGRKCSVCGERNAVFFWESKNKLKFQRYNKITVDLTENIERKYLADGEGLCLICFLKRTFDLYLAQNFDEIFKELSFPSTAEVAVSDFKEKAINQNCEAFYKYINKFTTITDKKYLKIDPLPKLKMHLKTNLEGSWFYKENLTETKIKQELNTIPNQEELKELKDLITNIYKEVGKPNPYYAIIYIDGDNMGKWLSGELLPEIQYAYNSKTWEILRKEFKEEIEKRLIKIDPERKSPKKILNPAIHSTISTALRNYAIEFVRKAVEEEYLGKLIYAGGDDVMAFVNLKDLLDVMEKLRWSFSGHIKIEKGEIKADLNNNSGFVLKDGTYYLTMGKNATSSMGVVIAHYKEPLKIVIDKVFEMNKRAKKEGKNKFAILLLKKSGEEKIGIANWNIDKTPTTQILKNLKEWMDKDREEKGYISDRFIHKFRKEFSKLKQDLIYEDLINSELKRLITRAYNGPKEGKKKLINSFFEETKKLLWNTGGDIDNFTNLLEIASFLNKGDR